MVLVGAGGGLLGSWLLARYLVVADRFKCNTNDLFAAQRCRLHKNFIRLHVDPDGALTVYPIKVERPPRRWKLRAPRPTAGEDEPPWFEPVPPDSLRAELIEHPVRIEPARTVSPAAAPNVRVGSFGR